MERLKQRYWIKFCQKLCDSLEETIRKIQIQTPVVTVEAFHVTKTKEGPPSTQQRKK